LHLPDPIAAVHHLLFEIADGQLHFEIAGILRCDFAEAFEKRLEARQIGHLIDLQA